MHAGHNYRFFGLLAADLFHKNRNSRYLEDVFSMCVGCLEGFRLQYNITC